MSRPEQSTPGSEVPEADAVEQARPVVGDSGADPVDDSVDSAVEADPADVAEQRSALRAGSDDDEDDWPRAD